MARTATSHKRESYMTGKLRKLGPNARSVPYDPTESLRDPRLVQKALLQCLEEGDFESLIEIYRAHLRVLNRTHTARRLNVSRTYIYKMLKPTANPTLRTFAAFMKTLKSAAETK